MMSILGAEYVMTSGGAEKKDLGVTIFERLKRSIKLSEQRFVVNLGGSNPFAVLIAIILSQNTNDKNSIAAMKRLKEMIGIDPHSIARARIDSIKEAIKPAGLVNQKATRIKKVAEMVVEGKLSLKDILEKDTETARRELISVDGIGPKTADVFLSIFGKRTFGVDTHAARVARRLGIVKGKSNYEKIRNAYMKLFENVDNLDLAHRYIIALGRTWCKALKPLCEECPLRDVCAFGNARIQQSEK